MTASLILPTPAMHMRPSFQLPSESSPWRERLAVAVLVIVLHLSLFAAYLFQPEAPAVMINEMSVSFAQAQAPQADVAPQPKPKVKQPEAKPDPLPAEQPAAVAQQTPPPAAEATPVAPVVLDSEPDYRADYLNNPRPPYPMVARRMGYHGKVVLNVEVLAEGKAGEVLLQQSCGYAILDNAALQTVKTWRFTPARRLGQPVTQWFLVPIKFSLEGNEA